MSGEGVKNEINISKSLSVDANFNNLTNGKNNSGNNINIIINNISEKFQTDSNNSNANVKRAGILIGVQGGLKSNNVSSISKEKKDDEEKSEKKKVQRELVYKLKSRKKFFPKKIY